MQGRRIYPDKDGRMMYQEGDYGKDPRNGFWYGRPPGQHTGSFGGHEVIEHDDETITVSPSILLWDQDENGNKVTLWHGFLERGVWRSV